MRRQKDNSIKKFIRTKFFFVIGIVLVAFVGLNVYRVWFNNHQVNQEIAELEAEIQAASTRTTELSELVSYLNSDAFIEKKARMDLGLKKTGEKTVVITDIETAADNMNLSDRKDDATKSNLQRWWQHFFKEN